MEIESTPITEEMREQWKERKEFTLGIEFEPSDLEWEDRLAVPLRLPRAAWKVIHAMSRACGKSPSEIIEDIVAKRLGDLIMLGSWVEKEDGHD